MSERDYNIFATLGTLLLLMCIVGLGLKCLGVDTDNTHTVTTGAKVNIKQNKVDDITEDIMNNKTDKK